jgi:glucose/mannose-6-phosphate isomerase|tara:strand:+ start:12 stop:1022 length:1011 start_codon:yes stop_codon:yes gene_type:complete
MKISDIQRYDSKKMYEAYDYWPKLAKEYYEKDFSKLEIDDVDHIVFAGMGGSGTIGDIISSILSKTNIHVNVVKGYLLPKTVDSNTLVVATSISGNTDEVLSILKNSENSKAKFISFSSDGNLEKISIENNIKHVKISQSHSPRASLPSFLYSILNVLENVIPIKKNDIVESISKLEKTQKLISSSNLNEKNPSLSLANWIKNIPIIYYPLGLHAAAIRFKNSLQENAKVHAISEDVIEACHNGIVAWENKTSVQPILIQGHDDYIKTKERWKIFKEFLQSRQIDFKEVNSDEGNILSKIMYLIYLLDYSTIYHAIESKIDPTPVKSIEFIKKRLK